MFALGLIETVGFTTALSAADAAVKAADVEIAGMEKVIGVDGYVSVTIHLTGDVAAVQSAVDAGRKSGEQIGAVVSTDVIPRAHNEVTQKLLSKYLINNEQNASESDEVNSATAKQSPDNALTEDKKLPDQKDQVKEDAAKQPKDQAAGKKKKDVPKGTDNNEKKA